MSTMKIWNTKYCLTAGIKEHDVDASQDGKLIRVFGCGYLYGEGREWHRTKESAIARAEEMRIAKLKSLDKQMKRISAIVFD